MAHDLQAVGDLDDANSRVGRILDDEFLVILSLQAGVLGLDGGYLVEAVDHQPNVLGECRDVYILVCAGGLVQVHGGGAGVGETDFLRDDVRHAVCVPDERRAVIPGLALERLHGNLPGRSFERLFHTGQI